MSFLFGGPSVPPPPPKIDYASAEAAADAERQKQRAAAGRASTMLTGGSGLTETATVGTTQLLGR